MYQGKRFLAVIPARGGSKGIPNKNIVEINGKPLIQYTIDAAIKSKYLDSVVVSTDSEEIANVVKKGIGVSKKVSIMMRPEVLATDNTKTIDVLVYVVENLQINYDYLVLLQPTQPFRQPFHIDEAIELIIEKGRTNLVSVTEVRESPILMRTINQDGKLISLLKRDSTVRRQDFPKYYRVNGAIYINKLDKDFTKNTSLNDNQHPYIMDRIYDIDIDEPLDLEIFKTMLSFKKGGRS